MGLVECIECGAQISPKAKMCPTCGTPEFTAAQVEDRQAGMDGIGGTTWPRFFLALGGLVLLVGLIANEYMEIQARGGGAADMIWHFDLPFFQIGVVCSSIVLFLCALFFYIRD